MTDSAPTLEVIVTPHGLPELELRERTCVVVDVLRACTTIAYALDAGARGVVPVETVEEATRLAQTLDRDSTLLAGERGSLRVDGFQLGNSPLEYTADVVAEKTIVLSTSNGARALAALRPARSSVAASFVTLGACARFVAASEKVTVVCAGSGARFSLEDFVCAGRIVEEVERLSPARVLDDGARTALAAAREHRGDLAAFLRSTDHGAALVELGFGQDLELAAAVDRFDGVPILRDGRLSLERPPSD